MDIQLYKEWVILESQLDKLHTRHSQVEFLLHKRIVEYVVEKHPHLKGVPLEIFSMGNPVVVYYKGETGGFLSNDDDPPPSFRLEFTLKEIFGWSEDDLAKVGLRKKKKEILDYNI